VSSIPIKAPKVTFEVRDSRTKTRTKWMKWRKHWRPQPENNQKLRPGFYVAKSVKEGHFLKSPTFDVKMGHLSWFFINFQQKSLLLTHIGDFLGFVIRLMLSPIG
jgi:hypothetical protein